MGSEGYYPEDRWRKSKKSTKNKAFISKKLTLGKNLYTGRGILQIAQRCGKTGFDFYFRIKYT
jgi:hypothetical protein